MRFVSAALFVLSEVLLSAASARGYEARPGEWIIFSSNFEHEEGDHNLYAIRPDGRELRNLTPATPDTSESNPCWYGGRVYFLSSAEFNGSRQRIESILPDGLDRRLEYSLEPDAERKSMQCFRISPDERWIAYTFYPKDEFRTRVLVPPQLRCRAPFPLRGEGMDPESYNSNHFKGFALYDRERKTERVSWVNTQGCPDFTPDGKKVVAAELEEIIRLGYSMGKGSTGELSFPFHRLVLIDVEDFSREVIPGVTLYEGTDWLWGSYQVSLDGSFLYLPSISAADFRAGQSAIWFDPSKGWSLADPHAVREPERDLIPGGAPNLMRVRWTEKGWGTEAAELLMEAKPSRDRMYYSWSPTDSSRPTLSPGGTELVYQNDVDGTKNWNLRRRTLETGEEAILTVTFRRDGKWNLHGPQWARLKEGVPGPGGAAAVDLPPCPDEAAKPEAEDAALPASAPQPETNGATPGGEPAVF